MVQTPKLSLIINFLSNKKEKMKLYVVPPMTYGRGMCKCRVMKGGYSPLLLAPMHGAGMKSKTPDMTKVRTVLSTLNTTNPRKKYISI